MRLALPLAAAAVTSLLGACSDADRARNAIQFSDRPADVLCTGYHGVLYEGRTSGRIVFDETGRINFVDARTGRLHVLEGECRVAYIDPANPAGSDLGSRPIEVPPAPVAPAEPGGGAAGRGG